MAYQNLFEQLKETCDFIALEDEMAQIINAYKKDLIQGLEIEIEESIRGTLVIENKEGIKYAVERILHIVIKHISFNEAERLSKSIDCDSGDNTKK